jgi:fucose permease
MSVSLLNQAILDFMFISRNMEVISMIVLLIIVYITFVSIGLPDSLLGAAWPSMYGDMGVPMSYMGVISMIFMGCTVISSAFSGAIIKRLETSTITIISILMIAVALLGSSKSHGLFPLCVFAVPLGLGTGCADAVLNNYVAINFKAKHMNWLHCSWGIGAAAGPMILSYGISHSGSWRSGYLVISIIQFCLAAAMLIFARPLWKAHEGIAARTADAGRTSQKIGRLFQLRGIKHALLAAFCYCAMQMTIGFWGSSYLVVAKNFTPETAAKLLSVFFLGLTFGRLLSGFLSIKLHDRQMIWLGSAVFACGAMSLLLPSGTVLYTASFLIMGLGCAPLYPCLLHATPDIFGKEPSQAVIGMQIAGAYIGAAVIPPVFGAAAPGIGFGFFLYFL